MGEVDPGWAHGDTIGDDRRNVKCKYCGRILNGGIHRFKCHIGHVSGDAKVCPNVPTEVRNEMREVSFWKEKAETVKK